MSPGAPEPSASPLTADADERTWLTQVHQPAAPQLTVRAILTGMALGAVMALSNVYVVLKTGFSLGVTLTSCLLAFAVFEGLRALRLTRSSLGLLENTMVGSVASSAGFMTGGGNLAAVPALALLTGQLLGGWEMVAWFSVIAALGVFVAIPVKRRLINVEQLPFPSSVAAAETLRSMHGAGGGRARSHQLVFAGALAAAFALLRGLKLPRWGWHGLPSRWALSGTLAGQPLGAWSFGLDLSPMMFASGTLMGLRTAWSMLAGSLVGFGVLGPFLRRAGLLPNVGFGKLVQLLLWPAAGMLLATGVVSLLGMIPAALRGLRAWRAGRGDVQGAQDATLADVECPPSWFAWGLALFGPLVVLLLHVLFAVPWWAGMLAVPLAIVMGFVAARVTGETDITPTKALGPATQMLYGALLPGQLAANVMSANVTGGVGLHAADLLSDLKTGRLLGASPRQQLAAQLFGVLAGALAVVPVYRLLVPDPSVLGTADLPAPAVQVWAAVSRVLTQGLGSLPPLVRQLAAAGAVLGLVLSTLERLAPRRWRPWLPSPSGFAIAFVIPASMTAAMTSGALLALLVRRRFPRYAAALIPLASGAIAGESLMGVLLALVSR